MVGVMDTDECMYSCAYVRVSLESEKLVLFTNLLGTLAKEKSGNIN